jgi:type II secretory pathway component PulC
MAELEAKKILKIRESDLLLSGAIIGKNAETRDAQLAEGCKEERARLEEIQAKKAKAQLQNDLAIMETDELQWQIRNDQAIAGLTGLA